MFNWCNLYGIIMKKVNAETVELKVSKYSKFKLPGSIGKKCKKCGADHWVSMLWRNPYGKKYLGIRCGKCMGKWKNIYRVKHPDQYREYGWKERGIDIDIKRYREIEKQQNSCCAICGKFNEKLRVDHCHKTGKVRALLCSKCNALALDIETIRAVLSYLEKYDKKG